MGGILSIIGLGLGIGVRGLFRHYNEHNRYAKASSIMRA